MFIRLQGLQPQEAKDLIDEVTGKASGVFLWVRLVVLSLLEGLRDGDTITDLQERLYLLPSDLEALFSKILDRLNPSYFEQASKLFQLVRASEEPLSLLTLSFIEDGFDKAMAAKVEPIPLAQAEYRAETMRRRLNSRCKGLLEAPIRKHEHISFAEVQYLHRTVKDFLNRPDIWEYIISGSPTLFDCDISLFGGFLFQIKSLSMSIQIMPRFQFLLDRSIIHSIKFESTKPDLHIASLKELEQAADTLFGSSHSNGRTWLEELFGSRRSLVYNRSTAHWTTLLDIPGKTPLKSFFDYAFQFPLYAFIDHELKTGRNVNSLVAGQPLLYAALNNFKLIEILFNNGADPNFYGGNVALTPWVHVLGLIENRDRIEDAGADMVSTFLEHNADPRAVTIVNGTSVEGVIGTAFFDWNQDRTDDLLRKVAVLKKKFKDPKKFPSRMKTFFKRLGMHGSKAT